MDVVARKLQFNPATQEWLFSGLSEKEITAMQIFFKEEKEYPQPSTKIDIPVSFSNNEFTATISLQEIAAKSLTYTKTNWKILAYAGSDTYTVQSDGPIHYSPAKNHFELFNYSFTFPLGELTLTMEPLPVKATLTNFSLDVHRLTGTVDFTTPLEMNAIDCSLLLKRRTSPNHYLFHDIFQKIACDSFNNQQMTFAIPLAELTPNFLLDDKNIIDALLYFSYPKTDQRIETFIEISSEVKDKVAQKILLDNPFYASFSAYVTGSNRLSFTFTKQRKERALLTDYKEDNGGIDLYLHIDDSLSEPELVLKRRDQKGDMYEYLAEQNFALKKGRKSVWHVKLYKEELLTNTSHQPEEVWDFFVRTANKLDFNLNVTQTANLTNTSFFTTSLATSQARFIAGNNQLSCLFRTAAKEPKKSAKKIALMGTCFSKHVFNSTAYFNPDYREFFECIFTQFHSSIISVMSQPYSHEIELSRYDDIPSIEKEYIRQDIEKNFFANLKATEAEYFLIDLYPDVVAPIIWLDNATAITYTHMIENSKLLDDLPIKQILNHENDIVYLNEWKKHAQLFIKKLTTIISPERIILNKGGFSTAYYDNSGKVAPYKNKMIIERHNVFWDQLNNYFLEQLPKAKVVDFSTKRYLGDSNHPFGLSPTHFESKYYQDFLKELIYLTQP